MILMSRMFYVLYLQIELQVLRLISFYKTRDLFYLFFLFFFYFSININ